jgi:hypothetical protein
MAFLRPLNLVALAIALIAAYMSREWIIGAAVVLLEVVYLGLVSMSGPFRRAVRARSSSDRGHAASLEAMLTELAPSQREHYVGLQALKDRILDNYRKLPGGQVLVAASESQLQELLVSFVRLLSALNSYRTYLNAANRKGVEDELRLLEGEIGPEANGRIRDVKQKRAEILSKRLQRFRQAEESREVISHQLAGIEDLLRLTHDQSIAIRDPDSVSRQLETLTIEAQATQESVREMEKFMDFTDEFRLRSPARVSSSP